MYNWAMSTNYCVVAWKLLLHALFCWFLPQIYIIAAFNGIPSPMLTVVTLDGQHTYECSHSETNKISWRVNDKVLGTEVFTIPRMEYTDFISHPGDAIYTLRIRAFPQNNETTIQCTAAFVGQSPQTSPVVTFLIQGRLITHSVCTCARRVLVLSVSVCVCYHEICLIDTSKTRCYRVLYGVFKVFVMWHSLKTLCSRVLVTFLVTAAFLAPWWGLTNKRDS